MQAQNINEQHTPSLAAFSILIVDDEPGICGFLERALKKHYLVVDIASNTAQAEALREKHLYDLLIVDINMPGQSGLDWVEGFDQSLPHSAVIFMTGYAELENAVAAVRLGAGDFVMKPFRLEQMLNAVARCFSNVRMSRENHVYQHRLAQQDSNHSIIGNSPQMQNISALIARVGATKSSVLIEGETGTGKELVASALHECSQRSGPFVPLNCAAIAPELIESELFGHVKGAYTNAQHSRSGLFSYADGGTLFLDEVSELPLALQSKLLRVLEESKIRPLGTDREKSIDVRIVAASNKSLADLVEQGLFRADLYYRLNILPITLPALREHPQDIGLLCEYFLKELAESLAQPSYQLSAHDLMQLQSYSWPGNVRELRNLLERSLLLNCSPGQLLNAQPAKEHQGFPLNWTLAQVQRSHVQAVLDVYANNKSQAAKVLGITRKTLDRKLLKESPDLDQD